MAVSKKANEMPMGMKGTDFQIPSKKKAESTQKTTKITRRNLAVKTCLPL